MQDIMRKIVVLCKYNQARSITAAAALRRFYPKEEIISGGILANPKTPIPSSILRILDEWGLHERDERSTATTSLPEVRPQDIVICADEEVRTIFMQQNKLDLVGFPHIYKLEDFARSKLEIPIDPAFLAEAETKNQLARSLVLALRGTRNSLREKTYIRVGHIPGKREEHLELQRKYNESNVGNRLMLDVGFSIPDVNIWSPSLNLRPFNPSRFEIFEGQLHSREVLISKFEQSETVKLLLSLSYLEWIKKIADNFSLEVIAQPFDNLPKNRHHEAILGMIHS
jgi:protein-tyrosine-phosphatase